KAIKPPTPDNELSSGPWRRRRASARRTRLCFFCHSCPGALLPPSLSRRTFWVPEASTVCCVINHEQQTTRALNSRSSCDFSRAQLLAPPTRWSEIQDQNRNRLLVFSPNPGVALSDIPSRRLWRGLRARSRS